MFTSARLKLTAWYLLIIMFVSVSFSVAMYNLLTSELNRVERIQRVRQERQLSLPNGIPLELRQRLPRQFMIDPELIEETKNRLKMILLLINVGIFSTSGLVGFFLASRTLKPIKDMVDEQNRFITDSSHELRIPITSLKTEIEVNLRDKKLNKETKRILESNLEEVNNLQALSDNLIKLAQYETSFLLRNQKSNGVAFEKLSLTEIIDESVKKVANMAKVKSITIKNETSFLLCNKVDEYPIEGDRQSLLELFVIFLDNAIKYSNKNTSITLTSRITGRLVIINIKDEGVGIDNQDIPHLFDRFYRVDKSRTKLDVEGFGLGLSIAKKIVDKHNGQIKVESEINKGTTFSIHLPMKQSRKII